MLMFLIIFLGTIQILRCSDSKSMYTYDSIKHDRNNYEQAEDSIEVMPNKASEDRVFKSGEEVVVTQSSVNRRYWLVSSNVGLEANEQEQEQEQETPDKENDDKDANIKSKIATLVEQTLHDTERKLRSLHRLRDRHKDEAPYRIGFILSLVKKSKDVLNELFNIAVKHRDDYKALEQLKIFEFIVHTNVDTTNFVRQMVEIHIQNVNSSSPLRNQRRVVLLK